jgi:hypothetical protein
MSRYECLAASFVIVLAGCGQEKAPPHTQSSTVQIVTPVSVSDVVPTLVDPDGGVTLPDDVAGATVALGGDGSSYLFAASFNAGLWRWQHLPNDATPWQQLANGPTHPFTIASDPANARHIAVGERDGDANPGFNHSGVWESFDAGDTWSYSLDPTSHGCTSQVVAGLVFTQSSNLIAATTCGLAVKSAGGWTWPTTPLANGYVTAVALGGTRTWARDYTGNLIVSSDEGLTWSTGSTTQRPTDRPQIPFGDPWSLAASDAFVVEVVKGDDTPDGKNNYSWVLIYDITNGSWSYQTRIHDLADNPASPNDSHNGTASYGYSRRFVKSYTIAGQQSFVFCDGQRLFQSLGVATGGGFVWKNIASSEESTSAPVNDPMFANRVHSELWDFHATADGKTLWLTTDGGVWENDLYGAGWYSFNPGMHTQHAHAMWTDDQRNRFIYATHDNSDWVRNPDGTWWSGGDGDSNFVVGDTGSANAFVVHGRDLQHAAVLGFDLAVPSLDQPPATEIGDVVLMWGIPWQDPVFFNFIQTLPGEPTPPGPLDAVMLADMPLLYGPAGATQPGLSTGQSQAILRNRQFVSHPNITNSNQAGWEVMADSVPGFMKGFYVGGGHAHPTLYALDSSGTLYRSDGKVPTTWTTLPVGGPLLVGGPNGPAFVNPYAPQELYALTAAGVRVSHDSGATWADDATLTDLVTGHGTWPITGTFTGINLSNLPIGVPKSNESGTLQAISWDKHAPDRLAAVGTFTGLFIKNGSGPWMDVSGALPRPLAPVSNVLRTGDHVFVSFEGRGVIDVQLPCFPSAACTGGATCGTQDDGCGGTISCGTCASTAVCDPSTSRCVDGSTQSGCEAKCRVTEQGCFADPDPNVHKYCISNYNSCIAVCDCVRATCASLGATCGSAPDNCGGTLSCGGCTNYGANYTCQSNQCVCQPLTDCTGRCGSIANGCGGMLRCPACNCTPSCTGKKCGASDGCGHTCYGYCRTGFVCNDDGDGVKICVSSKGSNL